MTVFEDLSEKIVRIEIITSFIYDMKKNGSSSVSVNDIQAKAGTKANMAEVILDLTNELAAIPKILRDYGNQIELLNNKVIVATEKLAEKTDADGNELIEKIEKLIESQQIIEDKIT